MAGCNAVAAAPMVVCRCKFIQRLALLAISLLGVLIFGAGFGLSFLDPLLIERAARELVRIELERQVGEKIDTLSNARIAGLAQRALQKADVDIQRTQAALREEMPRRVANVIADMLKADCECRKRLLGHLQRSAQERLSSLTDMREKLTGLVEAAYASVTRSLMREFRIFSASNAAAFAVLGVVTWVRRQAVLQLLLPAFVLLGAVAVTTSLYLFNQDWLHTLVFGEYVGFAYSLYLAGTALLLADVVLNRARVTTHIVNAALNAAGSAATAIPC